MVSRCVQAMFGSCMASAVNLIGSANKNVRDAAVDVICWVLVTKIKVNMAKKPPRWAGDGLYGAMVQCGVMWCYVLRILQDGVI